MNGSLVIYLYNVYTNTEEIFSSSVYCMSGLFVEGYMKRLGQRIFRDSMYRRAKLSVLHYYPLPSTQSPSRTSRGAHIYYPANRQYHLTWVDVGLI